MLETNQLTVKIGKKIILADITLEIKPGELLAVIGPNGAGKSTLLKSLCGEIKQTAGTVLMNGKKIESWSSLERAACCAVLPQRSNLSFPFSVLDVILMGRSPYYHSTNRQIDHQIVNQILALTGIAMLKQRIFTTLSGGERQRVQFARILAQIWQPVSAQSRYLLLDEPTSALDLSCQHDCLGIARQFAKEQGVGVLAILHDLNLAALYADRIAILQSGHLVAVDIPSKVLNEPLIKRVFNYAVAVQKHPLNLDYSLVIPMNRQMVDKIILPDE